MARRHKHQFRSAQRINLDAFLIDRNRTHIVGHQGEDIAHVRIARVFNRHRRMRFDQQTGQQIQRVLRTQRHQYFIAIGKNAAPCQDALADLFHQSRIVFGKSVICPGIQPLPVHGLPRAVAPRGNRKQRRIGLAIDERIGIIMPVWRFADIGLPCRVQSQLGVPVNRICRFHLFGKGRYIGSRHSGMQLV